MTGNDADRLKNKMKNQLTTFEFGQAYDEPIKTPRARNKGRQRSPQHFNKNFNG